jgi:phosphatidylserine decarboxylase
MMLKHTATSQPIAFVAIGALLVGSIQFTVEEGQKVKRGDELGYFAYGGSTIIVVFPKGLITFDDDLVVNSKKKLETLVKVNYLDAFTSLNSC